MGQNLKKMKLTFWANIVLEYTKRCRKATFGRVCYLKKSSFVYIFMRKSWFQIFEIIMVCSAVEFIGVQWYSVQWSGLQWFAEVCCAVHCRLGQCSGLHWCTWVCSAVAFSGVQWCSLVCNAEVYCCLDWCAMDWCAVLCIGMQCIGVQRCALVCNSVKCRGCNSVKCSRAAVWPCAATLHRVLGPH